MTPDVPAWELSAPTRRRAAWPACPPDEPHLRARAAAVVAGTVAALVQPPVLGGSGRPGTSGPGGWPAAAATVWELTGPAMYLAFPVIADATVADVVDWFAQRHAPDVPDEVAEQALQAWTLSTRRSILPELAEWLARAPGPTGGGGLLCDVADATWPLLDDYSAEAVLRAAAAVDAPRGEALAREVCRTPSAGPRVRGLAARLSPPGDVPDVVPVGVAVLIAHPQGGATRFEPERVRSWLAQLAAEPAVPAEAIGSVRVDVGPDGGYRLADEVAAGRPGPLSLVDEGSRAEAVVRTAQLGLGVWLPGVQVGARFLERVAVLAGAMLTPRAVVASGGVVSAAAELLATGEELDWDGVDLPEVLWLPWTTPAEVADALHAAAGPRLRRLDDGSLLVGPPG